MTRVLVVGAGTMGHGIAQVAAQAGCDTTLADTDPAALERALRRIGENLDGAVQRGKMSAADARTVRERINTAADLAGPARQADLVIEAVVEDLAVKDALLRRLDDLVGADAIVASNTSSLSITRLASASRHPERVIGMHFFNPVHLMKLVEIVSHQRADPAVVERVTALAREMGKEPILVRDSPGFASSRLGVALGLEAMRMLETGVASAEDIDRAMELGYGHPMGPLRVTDLVGLDVRLAIAETLFRELGQSHYQPPAILRAKVQAGELGKKTGKGFYQWPKPAS